MLKKRLEILISNDEYILLKEKAKEDKCSIGELVRESLREKYFVDKDGNARKALDEIISGDLALDTVEWDELESFLEKRYADSEVD
ncbi:MAG: hypothetical protein AB1420_13470 [Bacillota bacterium]